MAYVVVRKGPRGDRYTGMYRTKDGGRKSAGTFDNEAKALEVAEAMETFDASRGATSPSERALVTLEDYVEKTFLRMHVVSPVTKRGYASTLEVHVLPVLGKVRVAELTREQVRDFLATKRAAGLSPSMQRRCRVTLSAVMRMALEDGYRDDNPARGVRTDRQGRKEVTVLTVAQYKALRKALPTDGARLMVQVTVSSGLRFGEVTALTAGDFPAGSAVLVVNKAVSDVGAEFHPNGRDRFILNPYPKSGRSRALTLDPGTLKAVRKYIEANDLGDDDLLFSLDRIMPVERASFPARKYHEPLSPERLEQLGTFEAPNGLTYQHGTPNAYVTGKCKCEGCRQAISEYSSARRAAKRPRTKNGRAIQPRHYSVNSQGYLGRDSWRKVWKAAIKAAEIPFEPTSYQLRHTHASWLIEGGEDPKTVMGRLGHTDLTVTSLYVHRVASDASAAAIMSNLLDDDDDDEDVA